MTATKQEGGRGELLRRMQVGFIGGGMMAEAIARGLIDAGISPQNIIVADPDERRRQLFEQDLGVKVSSDNASSADSADVLILAVKPSIIPDALDSIRISVRPDTLVISIAAGISTASIEAALPVGVRVIRAMPNTPCLIRQGATALAPGSHAGPQDMDLARTVFEAVGKVVCVTEDKMDAVTGLSGSAPAYVYMFIEALADGGVRMGLPKDIALFLAAQTVSGAARMVIESGEHPAALRDRVMTPGGTTVAGVAVLESGGFRSAAIEAVTAAAKRSAELGKK